MLQKPQTRPVARRPVSFGQKINADALRYCLSTFVESDAESTTWLYKEECYDNSFYLYRFVIVDDN